MINLVFYFCCFPYFLELNYNIKKERVMKMSLETNLKFKVLTKEEKKGNAEKG